MSKWRRIDVDKDIQHIPPGNWFRWHDCTVGLRCICGGELSIDDQDEESKCPKCGKLFRLCAHIEVKDKEV